MINYFEIFDKRLSAIEINQLKIIDRLAVSTPPRADEVGGIELACSVTRLSKARIYTLVSERAIPHAKRGNRLYFNRTELLAWVAEGNRAEKGGPDA